MAAGGVPPSGALSPHLRLHPLPARVARLAQEEGTPGAVQTVHGLLPEMPGIPLSSYAEHGNFFYVM